MTGTAGRPLTQEVAAGTAIGASILLLAVGMLAIFQGISAILEDDVVVAGGVGPWRPARDRPVRSGIARAARSTRRWTTARSR